MPEIITDLLPILTLLAGFIFGQLAEKRKQALSVRSEMLRPIEEWLAGVEQLNGMVGDTLTTLLSSSPTPIMYNLEERLKINKSMIEQSNRVFGILESNALRTWSTRKLVHQLRGIMHQLESEIRDNLAHVGTEMFERVRTQNFTEEFGIEIFQRASRLNSRVREAYSLISKIKTSLT